jgi:hypothetical protein
MGIMKVSIIIIPEDDYFHGRSKILTGYHGLRASL